MSDKRIPSLGTCCSTMAEVLKLPNPLFRVEDNGVLYLSVGYSQTPKGVGWFDQAPFFCPFCGTQIQDRETTRKTAKQS